MRQSLVEKLNTYLQLGPEEEAFLETVVPQKRFHKGARLLEEGEVSQEFFFLNQGCIRMYYTVGGEEKTAFFYTEGEFVSSYRSFVNQVPARHGLECLEDCHLSVIGVQEAGQLLQRFPKFETLSRMVLEEELGMYQDIVANYVVLSPEERYLHMQEHHAELLARVPLYALASYIGVAPETLSRIRKRIRDRGRS